MRKRKPKPTELAFYEGLVRKTAGMYARLVEDDYEDICQVLRLKAWRALNTYDPARSKLPVERYVFSCLRNQVKDLLKKKKREELFLLDLGHADATADSAFTGKFATGAEGITKQHFEARYLSIDEEAGLSGLLDDMPTIPSTLSGKEKEVLALVYYGYSHTEIAVRLEISKREISTAMKAIKVKMSDWKPSDDSCENRTTAEDLPIFPEAPEELVA